jgi:hypothetical protein
VGEGDSINELDPKNVNVSRVNIFNIIMKNLTKQTWIEETFSWTLP